MPDTFFRNEKDAKFHDIIQPNLYVRVFPNGDVLYSIRVNRIKYIVKKCLILLLGLSDLSVSYGFEIVSSRHSGSIDVRIMRKTRCVVICYFRRVTSR